MPTATADVQARFHVLEDRLDTNAYNFDHFSPAELGADIKRTIRADGVRPGETAPDFTLPEVGGNSTRLRDLLGRPVLLHFGSPS